MRYLIHTMSMALLLSLPVYLVAETDTDTEEASTPAMPQKAVVEKTETDYAEKRKQKKPKKLPDGAEKTVRHEGSKIIEEYRVKGRLTMVKIISKKAKPYFIYYDEDWNQAPGSKDLDDTPKTPYWKIFSW